MAFPVLTLPSCLQVFKRNVIENIVPTVVSLKHMVSKRPLRPVSVSMSFPKLERKGLNVKYLFDVCFSWKVITLLC